MLTELAAAYEESTHAPGEAPRKEGFLLCLVGRWASSGGSHARSASKTTATLSDAVYLLEGIVMVYSHFNQLQGCVGYAVVAGSSLLR